MNQIEKITASEFGLEEYQAVTIEQAFMPKIVERDALKEVYEGLLTKEITPAVCQDAKTLRLKLVKVRTGIADIHKSQKAFFLAAGKFVDEWKRKETLPVIQMEENLSVIEEHYARIEAEKVKALQEERSAEMLKYEADFIPGNLGELTEQVWGNFILGTKVAFEQKKEGERLRLEAEEKRIAEEKAEQERIKAENIRLKAEAEAEREKAKKEAEELEKKLAIERAKVAAEKKVLEDKLCTEGEAAASKLKAEQDASRIAAEKAQAERKALEAELAAKAAEEKRKSDEAEANLQSELAKGDTDKFNDLIRDLESLKTKYSFKSEKNKKKYSDVALLLEKIIVHIR